MTTTAVKPGPGPGPGTTEGRPEVPPHGGGGKSGWASSPDGLSQAEATKRLAQYGPNEIVAKKTNQFLKLLSYFWGRSRG